MKVTHMKKIAANAISESTDLSGLAAGLSLNRAISMNRLHGMIIARTKTANPARGDIEVFPDLLVLPDLLALPDLPALPAALQDLLAPPGQLY